jgi:proline iminopeptidase
MKHVCKLGGTIATPAAPMNSNIDAMSATPPASTWPRPQRLAVGPLHRMAWRELGQPAGEPWLLLHGGPGGACQPGMLRPFDLSRQRVIAPDQRGAGASRPRGRTMGNNTAALVADLESLRCRLGIGRWSLLAGSWGTVVALAYAQRHPERVQRLVLRGAFALTRREIGGLLLPSVKRGQTLRAPAACWPVRPGTGVPVALARLRQLLQNGTPGVASLRALRGWGLRETADAMRGLRRSLRHAQLPQTAAIRRDWAAQQRSQRRALAALLRPGMRRSDRAAWGKFRVQAHYLLHRGFVRPGALDHAVRLLALRGTPVDWVHGRFDAICPPANSARWAAQGLAAGGPVVLHTPPCGHLGGEPAMLAQLRVCVRLTLP